MVPEAMLEEQIAVFAQEMVDGGKRDQKISTRGAVNSFLESFIDVRLFFPGKKTVLKQSKVLSCTH